MKWLESNLDLVWELVLAHIGLSVPPILIGFLVSIPIGWLANRYRPSRGVILVVLGLLYTVPSIPLFIFMPIFLGTPLLSPVNVVVALTIYAVALMVRTAADGLASVDDDTLLAASAMGYSGWQRFWRVELPLSGPVLLSGLRVVSASTVSLATLGVIIGVQSLGYLFTNGFQRNIPAEVITGIVATLVIAVVFDLLLVLVGRLLLPWSTPDRRRKASRRTTPALVAGGVS
ncbi:ABC transporter permease [Herbiconiux flava]|uniref:Osmoprotectant transport system permease protein n=1 Tax=Herbiconiux flava TaxID=881268 RepID=A0A852SPJ5_9MICO|nr:ABC transporter permease subunit [Herbiconiux flava]NYD70798.1 osmoprotectant transport system permease protein [Herbiconiux flava]GLK17558.1 ABC transporter permease [Herbiconiux flava]